jgi:hypothetical protein
LRGLRARPIMRKDLRKEKPFEMKRVHQEDETKVLAAK